MPSTKHTKADHDYPRKRSIFTRSWIGASIGGGAAVMMLAGASQPSERAFGDYIVLANNDLGMHCMMRDFSHFMILPPFNTVQAVLIKRGHGPDVIDISEGSDFTLEHSIPGNSHSSTKSNFWKHDQSLLGVDLPPDIGITGYDMSGELTPPAGFSQVFTGETQAFLYNHETNGDVLSQSDLGGSVMDTQWRRR